MTMRALIVDDEPLARRALRQLLARHDDVEIVDECADGVDAAGALARHAIDVVFLDIRMPAISGLRVASGIATRPLVVFVTAHDEHGVDAFEIGAADYVVKPVTARRLDAAIARVRTRLADLHDSAKFRELHGAGERLDRLVVRVGARDVVIPTVDVDLFVADDVYVAVHVGGHKYLMRASLDQLAGRLDPARFIRVHRSYVVPLAGIVAVHHRRGGEAVVELRNGASVPVSRRRKDVLAQLESAAARG
jgi:two-component system LytT family response regulator